MDANIQLNINQTTLAQKKFLVGKSSVILSKNLKFFAVINAAKILTFDAQIALFFSCFFMKSTATY